MPKTNLIRDYHAAYKDTLSDRPLNRGHSTRFEGALSNEKPEYSIFYILLGLSAVYLINTIVRLYNFAALSWLQTFNTIFLSILLQAIPFVLIGIIVSSILQVAIPSETLVKIFPQKRGVGFITAIFAGVFFPVCDCVIIPVAARLIKKGVPLPVAITFMLAAPVVNPIVIASTLYAFPKQPEIAFYRVCLGVVIAVIVGVIIMLFQDNKSIYINNIEDNISCDCHCCKESKISSDGMIEKVKKIFIHANSEFFLIGKFLIIGAFFSSLFQTCISKDVFNNLSERKILSLLVMMLAAFVFSICSTSDAFVAKAFSAQFSVYSLMGFLVLGPMIDIKNMLMLLSSFRKSFVVKLIVTIFIVTFLMLYFVVAMLN